jgi:hypothetical protein
MTSNLNFEYLYLGKEGFKKLLCIKKWDAQQTTRLDDNHLSISAWHTKTSFVGYEELEANNLLQELWMHGSPFFPFPSAQHVNVVGWWKLLNYSKIQWTWNWMQSCQSNPQMHEPFRFTPTYSFFSIYVLSPPRASPPALPIFASSCVSHIQHRVLVVPRVPPASMKTWST